MRKMTGLAICCYWLLLRLLIYHGSSCYWRKSSTTEEEESLASPFNFWGTATEEGVDDEFTLSLPSWSFLILVGF